MTAILRPVTSLLPSGVRQMLLFGAIRDPDCRPHRRLASEHVTQGRLELGVAEVMTGVDQPLRTDVLARLSELAGALPAPQQPGTERGERDHGGPAQHR